MFETLKTRNIPPITRIAISLSNNISHLKPNQFDIKEINLNLIRAQQNWIKILSNYQKDLDYLKELFIQTSNTLLHLRQIRTKLTRGDHSLIERYGLLNISLELSELIGLLNSNIDKVNSFELQRLISINQELQTELENIKVTTSWNSLMILTSLLPNAIEDSMEGRINYLLNKYSHPFSLQKIDIETIERFFSAHEPNDEKRIRILTAYSSGPLIAGIIYQKLRGMGYSVNLEIIALYSNSYSFQDIHFPIVSSQVSNKPRFEGFTLIIDDQFQSYETAEALQRYARLTSIII